MQNFTLHSFTNGAPYGSPPLCRYFAVRSCVFRAWSHEDEPHHSLHALAYAASLKIWFWSIFSGRSKLSVNHFTYYDLKKFINNNKNWCIYNVNDRHVNVIRQIVFQCDVIILIMIAHVLSATADLRTLGLFENCWSGATLACAHCAASEVHAAVFQFAYVNAKCVNKSVHLKRCRSMT